MTFGGLICDPLRGAVNHNGQMLMPEQIIEKEKTERVGHLERKVEMLQRDNQLLEAQVELNDDLIPEENPLTIQVTLLQSEKAELQQQLASKTTQLNGMNGMVRAQNSRILQLNQRLNIGQPRQPDRMTITQHHIDQLFDFSGQQFGGNGANGNNDAAANGNQDEEEHP